MRSVSMLVTPLLLGIPWMDPQWLLDHFHTQFVWLSLVIVFIECGLFFPFLPGDTLLFAMGLFISAGELQLNLGVALAAFCLAAFLGNVVGYEIGRRLGTPLYRHDGRILKREYLDRTRDFFDRHGNQALVIGRFVPFIRTYITLVAGITAMERRRFLLWSLIGALAWVPAITLLGYFLGTAVPWLATQIDLVVLGLLVLSVVPLLIEWWRRRRLHGR